MSSSTASAHRERSLADEEATLRLRLCVDHAPFANIDTQDRFLEVQRGADALANQELESAEQALTQSLDTSRATLPRDCVPRIPDDIWRCIFEEAVQDKTGSRVAFVLAHVSSQWRQIALSTPRIWSRIWLFPLQIASAKQLEAVKLLVSRSGACPLTVKIWWLQDLHEKDHLLSSMRDILCVLSDQAHRWGAFRLILPGRVGRDALTVLKAPTPKLELLSIVVRAGEWASDVESGYLPYAPMLKSLTLEDAAMACSAFATYPALTNVKVTNVTGNISSHIFLDILSRARDSLETIEVNAWLDRSAHLSEPLLLPRLQTLVLLRPPREEEPQAIPAVSLISTPRLTHLNLPWNNISAIPVSFLATVSATVRTLTIHNVLTADFLERLRHLQNVERVEFGILIDDAAYFALTTHVPPIWPRLVVMDLRGPSINSACDPLIKFIASRNLPRAERGRHSETAGPCRLRDVILAPEAPQWVSTEVQRLLAL